jgi:hypothetical protein
MENFTGAFFALPDGCGEPFPATFPSEEHAVKDEAVNMTARVRLIVFFI